jgi:hypothetical protein
MSEVENQSTAPAAPSVPAAGEASPPAADPTNTAPPAAATTEPAKAPQPTAADEGEEEDGSPKRPSRSARLQRKLQLVTAELDELRRTAPREPARPQPDAGSQQRATENEDKPPKEEDFKGDFLAFERALNAFNVKQAARDAVRSENERARSEQSQTRQREIIRERILAHEDRVDELRERVPDFETTMKTAADVRLREEVAEEILASEKSALLQYHLAKNPEKARELNGLTGRELARAIGRLEGQVRLPAAKKATDATPPVAPLQGGGASPAFNANNESASTADRIAHWRAADKARAGARTY